MQPRQALTRVAVLVALIVPLGADMPALGQPVSPPPPARYRVRLRYRTRIARNARIADFMDLTRHLQELGFRKDPGTETEAEDPFETRMTGTISAVDAPGLLADPRVQSVLFVPGGIRTPEDPAALLKVQLRLADGLPPPRQLELWNQVRARLAQLGFQESVGYDHRRYTRVFGSIPGAELDTLLEDLREQPSGWLTPDVPVAALSPPLRDISPIQVIELVPESEAARRPPEPSPPPAGAQTKVSPDVAVPPAAGQTQAEAVRLEVILGFAPASIDTAWQRALSRAVPGLVIEGRLGPIVTVRAPAASAPALAEVPIVSGVRLPRPALAPMRASAGPPFENQRALDAAGLTVLHRDGYRGKGVRVALIGSDFRAHERFARGRQARTRYIDVTVERNPTLVPDPFPGPAGVVGHGTQAAMALTLAAPDVDLTLIRIDSAAPYQLVQVARYLQGEPRPSDSAGQRSEQLAREADSLNRRRAELARDRQAYLEAFGQEPDPARRLETFTRKPEELEAEARARRAELDQREAALHADDRAHRVREEAFVALEKDLTDLREVQAVCCTLVWNEGYPADGSSALTRFFDERPTRAAVWLQAAGDTRGQTWAGLFHDADGNGVLEFAPLDAPLVPGRWTSELNFMAWQPFTGARSPDLPSGQRFRLSLQWTEAHDPEFFNRGEDLYRTPLADLRFLVLRQRDPSGRRLPSDDLDVVAVTTGVPQRIENRANAATYEQVLEFNTDPAGRYAVRIEGHVPTTTRPPGVADLPALAKLTQVPVRLFVETAGSLDSLTGRPVFLDYVSDAGGLGTPADAREVVTVGAADYGAGRPRPWGTVGPPLGRLLLPKPNVFSYDELTVARGGPVAYGSALATPFAAGLAAVLIERGTAPAAIRQRWLNASGELLYWPSRMTEMTPQPGAIPRPGND
jgi:hypothetical protein